MAIDDVWRMRAKRLIEASRWDVATRTLHVAQEAFNRLCDETAESPIPGIADAAGRGEKGLGAAAAEIERFHVERLDVFRGIAAAQFCGPVAIELFFRDD